MASTSSRVSSGADNRLAREVEDEHFRVYIRTRDVDHGAVYYRLQVPCNAMKSQDIGAFYHDEDPPKPNASVPLLSDWNLWRYKGYLAEAKKGMEEANIFMAWAESAPQWGEFAKAVRKAHEGTNDPPPTFLWDIDDHTEFCSPFNPAFVNLGCRRPDGTDMEEGESVWGRDSVNGEEVELWKDGEIYSYGQFDIKRNKQAADSLYANARAADGVSVATPALAEWYRDHVGCENVYVAHNGICLDDYPSHFIPKAKSGTEGEIRILWQGGDSHVMDLINIKPAIVRVAKKYPHVKFVTMGSDFGPVWRDIPPGQHEHHGWVKGAKAYRAYLSTLGHDINICPLTPEKFNAYKSAIKWYESSVLTKPAATLAQDFGPYDEITDGETGLLASPHGWEDFEEKLCMLIENDTLRWRLAYGAQDWVLRNRRAEKLVLGWRDWVRDTRRKARFKV